MVGGRGGEIHQNWKNELKADYMWPTYFPTPSSMNRGAARLTQSWERDGGVQVC